MKERPLIDVVGLKKYFPVRKTFFAHRRDRDDNLVRAVDGVDLSIARGEVLGLVGESGSGKSTLGRSLMMLDPPTEGHIVFDNVEITPFNDRLLKPYRKRMQMIFQDPYGSLNPRMSVGDILAMPLRFHNPELDAAGRREKAGQALETVGLAAQYLDRYPHEFSGGQRQRIGIARALTLEPEFIMADEPVSALDVSVQAQVLNLFARIRRQMNLTMLFVTHDLAVVGHIADRVAVMYLGRIVEIAPTRELFSHPRHPYTEALMSAIPMPEPGQRRQRIVLQGDIPSPISPPSGCAFRTRCPYVLPACAQDRPLLREVSAGHGVACIRDDLELVSPLTAHPSPSASTTSLASTTSAYSLPSIANVRS